MLSLLLSAIPVQPNPWKAAGPPSVVRLTSGESGWRLTRNGQPYFIQGAGSQKMLKELAEAGGNSIRTWGADDETWKILDEAHRHGLTVTLGFWLMKAGDDGFSYLNAKRALEQKSNIERLVKRYRAHPALLMWAIGNEMELGLPANQAEAMWSHVNDIAFMIKKQDPGRPVMSVVADMWPEKMAAILKHSPNLDLLGVNSYTGLPGLHSRMKDWKKPYVITEFQHPIAESKPDVNQGLPIEPTSTEKARIMTRDYVASILSHPGRVLGSYVFYWDKSDNQVSSWYNMHLKTGERLQAVDDISYLWTGRRAANRSPEIHGAQRLDRDGFHWKIWATDPERDPISYELQVISEDKARFVGDFEQTLKVAHSAKVTGEFRLPETLTPGRYRAVVILRDGKGGAAVWNQVFRLPTSNLATPPPSGRS